MTPKEDEIFMKITNADIYKEILAIQDVQAKAAKVQGETLEQVKYTNWRVTKLEEKSLWLWIGNHPFKFVAFVLTLISVLKLNIPEILSNFF